MSEEWQTLSLNEQRDVLFSFFIPFLFWTVSAA